MDNIGGWLITVFAFIMLLWGLYSLKEFDKKEKHG